MAYAAVRDEISTQLLAVSGIGVVFKSPKNPNDWAAFFSLYKTASLINVTWFTLASAPETVPEQGIQNEKGQEAVLERNETWIINLFYGYDDDDTTPSEFGFQTLVEAIQDKFRFLFDLNGTADKSFPLELVSKTEEPFGDLLVHRAEFSLLVQHIKRAP